MSGFEQVAEGETRTDLLAGIPDFSDGRAHTYFAGLNESDREITQWYLTQGIGPWQIEGYVSGLVKGFAVADPTRAYHDGMHAAHAELGRINRFLEIFLASDDFFPWPDTFNVSVRDEDGNYEGSIDITGWSSFGGPRDSIFALHIHRQDINNSYIKRYIELAAGFIDDPLHAPLVFNQERILAEAREAAQASPLVDV